METVVVPEGLAAMPPGPELGAVLGGVDLAGVPNDEILAVLRAQYRQLCHEQARMIAVIAEVGRCEGYPDPGQIARLDHPEPYASDETRAALRWTRRAADAEHDLAETVVFELPAVFAAWLAGEIDRPRVRVFERYLVGLTAAQVARICAVAVPRAPRLTTGQLAVLLRRMVIAVDPAAAERWYRKGVHDRNVIAFLDADGTVTMAANGLPADQAEAACVRLQDLAAAAKRAGHPGLIGQIRCDLFLGMLDGRYHHMTPQQIITALIADHRATPTPNPVPQPDPPDTTHPADRGLTPNDRPVPTPDDEPGHDDRPDDGEPDDDRPEDDGPDGGPNDDEPDHDDGGPDDGGPDDGGGPADNGSDGGERGAAGPTAPDERVGIEIRVGLSTLLGRDEHPGEIPGLGLLLAPESRRRVAIQGRAEWRFALTDPAGHLLFAGLTRHRPHPTTRRTGPRGGIVELHIPLTLLEELTSSGDTPDSRKWAGVLTDIADQYQHREDHQEVLDSHPHARRPGAALRRHTQIRDRTCIFIGCRRPATGCEQDHTHDHAHGGVTVTANLGPTCGHDHDVKHRGRWQLTQPQPGQFIWHSPLGGIYQTHGESFLPPMPQPEPAPPEPTLEPCTPQYDEPIVHRPPRPPPPPPAPPTPVFRPRRTGPVLSATHAGPVGGGQSCPKARVWEVVVPAASSTVAVTGGYPLAVRT